MPTGLALKCVTEGLTTLDPWDGINAGPYHIGETYVAAPQDPNPRGAAQIPLGLYVHAAAGSPNMRSMVVGEQWHRDQATRLILEVEYDTDDIIELDFVRRISGSTPPYCITYGAPGHRAINVTEFYVRDQIVVESVYHPDTGRTTYYLVGLGDDGDYIIP